MSDQTAIQDARGRFRHILALDTCFEACSVAVGIDDGGGDSLTVVTRFEPMKTGQAERILPMVRDVVADAGIAMSLLDVVAVTVGPGSFTGTRIGLSAAKGLALALGVPTAGFTSLNVIAQQVAATEPGTCDICVAVDMGRDDIYAQLFDPAGLAPRTEALLVSAGEIESFAAQAGARLVGRGPRFMTNMAVSNPTYSPRAETLVALVTQCNVKLPIAVPLYLRPPDAKPPRAGAIGRGGQGSINRP